MLSEIEQIRYYELIMFLQPTIWTFVENYLQDPDLVEGVFIDVCMELYNKKALRIFRKIDSKKAKEHLAKLVVENCRKALEKKEKSKTLEQSFLV